MKAVFDNKGRIGEIDNDKFYPDSGFAKYVGDVRDSAGNLYEIGQTTVKLISKVTLPVPGISDLGCLISIILGGILVPLWINKSFFDKPLRYISWTLVIAAVGSFIMYVPLAQTSEDLFHIQGSLAIFAYIGSAILAVVVLSYIGIWSLSPWVVLYCIFTKRTQHTSFWLYCVLAGTYILAAVSLYLFAQSMWSLSL